MKGVYLCLLCLLLLDTGAGEDIARTDYCIVGAGPSGLQLGYFLEDAGRDYVIFEKNSTAGSFFLHYPRHRTLISINKRFTGSTNTEFNFRHDWNSLISEDENLQMTRYTKEYFPPADTYVQYLQDFAREHKLNVKYDTEIKLVKRLGEKGGRLFDLQDQNDTHHHCRTVIMCTGLWVPNVPQNVPGMEYVAGYEEMSLDLDEYEGKKVLIIGRGNAGFETADHIVSRTALIHMVGRSRIKFAYQTHYVGDVRAVNAQQVDTYQLKSLDGQFEGEFAQRTHVSIIKNKQGALEVGLGRFGDPEENRLFDHPYDIIIRCLGFKFDFSPFDLSSVPVRASTTAGKNKYPHILSNYRAVGVPDLYFAGVNTHSLDFKKSAGAFIHGFRYTTRALFRHLEWEYNGVPWPSVRFPYSSLLSHLLRRINEASGPYQMFSVLSDVALIRDDGMVDYLEEVPVMAMPKFKELTGHDINRFILWEFEYGKNYSGPGNDVLSEDRVHGDPEEADLSNFLHPVLYYYRTPPKLGSMWKAADLPTPDSYHHIVEDFLTDWTSRPRHVLPLRYFLEAIFDEDLRRFLPETCFQLFFTHGADVPLSCRQDYLQGRGISLSDGYVDFGPLESLEGHV